MPPTSNPPTSNATIGESVLRDKNKLGILARQEAAKQKHHVYPEMVDNGSMA